MSQPINIYIPGSGVASGVTGAMFATLLKQFPELDNYDNLNLFATSGAVGTVMYYLSHRQPGDLSQYFHVSEKIWKHDIATKQFVYPSHILNSQPTVDVQYLVDVIFKKNNPLRIEQISQSTHGFAFPVYNTDSHVTEWFVNKKIQEQFSFDVPTIDTHKVDVYAMMRAAKSIPFFDNRVVEIAQGHYTDGGAHYPIPLLESTTIQSKNIVLLSQMKQNYSKIAAIWVWIVTMVGYLIQLFWPYSKQLSLRTYLDYSGRRMTDLRLVRQAIELEKKGDLIIIEPVWPVGKTSSNGIRTLENNYKTGQQSIMDNIQKIKDFLQKTTTA